MKSNSPVAKFGRRKKIALSAVVLVVLYTITGFLIVPWAIKALLPRKLSEFTHRTVTLESAAFNPFTLALTLENFAILEKDKDAFASVGRLYANAQLFPLFIGKAVLKDLVIEQPAVSVARDKAGIFNFADLVPAPDETPEKRESNPDSRMPAFLVKNIAVTAGKIAFADRAAGAGFSLTLDPFSVSIKNLGSREKEPASYRFDMATRSGAVISGNGTASITDLTSEGKVNLDKLILTQFEPYYRKFIKANIKSGRAGAKFSYRYPAGPASPLPGLSEAQISLKNFVVTGPQGSVRKVKIADFLIAGIEVDPEKQTVRASRLLLSDTDIRAVRSKEGGIYLIEAFLPTIDRTPEPPDPSAEKNSKPWNVRLEQLAVKNLSVAIEEYSARTPSVYSLERVDVQASGIEYDTGKMDGIPRIEKAGVSLTNIKIAAVNAEEAAISIPTVEIEGVNVDPFAGLAKVASITSRQGIFSVQRTADGSINLIDTLPSIIAPPPEENDPQQPETTEKARLVARIDAIALEDYSLTINDQVPATPAVLFLDRIAITAGNISTAPAEKATLSTSLRWDEGGTLTTRGALTLAPLSGEIEIQADQLEITPVQPYLNEKIQLLITGGTISTTGRATFHQDPDQGLMANFKGKTLVANFSSLDKHLGKDFLRWKSLAFSGIDVDINPLKVVLDEIALADFYARATVNADGTINLRTILASKETAAESPSVTGSAKPQPVAEQTPPADQESVPVTINAITLQGGTVSFADRLIEPHFETEMLELGGNISGLSSAELARADVFLAGRLENYSPLKITGKINPLTRDRFSDISIEFRDIDLSPFSPYTGKYLGYKLEKGKLTLILNYRLSQNTLVAQNKIRFNRLTLGEKVDSPDATSLPVKLGLAILSDREGNIELDLPVRGSVDDPEFSLGSIILQGIIGLITKTISSPFAALGSAFAGGAELSYIDFEAGQTNIGENQAETLANLANALYERPALNLEITGMVDPAADTAELRNFRYKDLLRAQQARALYKGGQAPPESERPAISAEKREAYVARAFQAADFPKPKNPDGTLKELPVAEMEKLLFTAIIVSPGDLHHLAMERAEAAKDALLKDDRLKPERLYITAPVIEAQTDAAEPPRSQAKFAVQK